MLKPGSPDSLNPTLCSSVGPLSVKALCNVENSSFRRVLAMTSRSEQLPCLGSSSSHTKKASEIWGLWILHPALPLILFICLRCRVPCWQGSWCLKFYFESASSHSHFTACLSLSLVTRRKKKANFYPICWEELEKVTYESVIFLKDYLKISK